MPLPLSYSGDVWEFKNANVEEYFEAIQKSFFNWERALGKLPVSNDGKVGPLSNTLLNIFGKYIPNK